MHKMVIAIALILLVNLLLYLTQFRQEEGTNPGPVGKRIEGNQLEGLSAQEIFSLRISSSVSLFEETESSKQKTPLETTYSPENDLPAPRSTRHTLCIVIPFRDSQDPKQLHAHNRTQNLHEFLPQMRRHLSKFIPSNEFVFVIAEQADSLPFNKGALFNVAFLKGEELGLCDYSSYHDVDQIPLSNLNTYQWTSYPLHQCTNSDQYPKPLGVDTDYHVGGALLLNDRSYRSINGFSNCYWGWGYEDNDMGERIRVIFGAPKRLDPEAGRYSALGHDRENEEAIHTVDGEKNHKMYDKIGANLKHIHQEGVNSVVDMLHPEVEVRKEEQNLYRLKIRLQYTECQV